MAFRMNRPVIKGTANHKASIAKAKAESIVSQRRTQADTGLVAAADALGKSYKPAAIDFELDKINIDVPEKKEKNRIQAERTEADRINKENEAAAKAEADRIAEEKRLATLKAQEDRFRENKLDITSEVDESERLLQSIEEKKGEDIKTKPKPKDIVRSNILTEEDIAIMNEKAKKAAAFDPEDERVYTKEDRERLKFDERTGEMRLPEEIAADKTTHTTEPVVEETKTITPTDKPKISDFKTKKNPFGGTLTAKDQYEKALKEYYSKSPMDMRDNRIYRNAVKGGTVQQNMIKSGYIPE